MNTAERLHDPLEQINTQQAQGMETAAFLGALDDLFDEFTGLGPDRRPDHEIMKMVSGISDQASEYYSAERTETLSLFSLMSQRLGEMACSHDHFRQALKDHAGIDFGDENHKSHDHALKSKKHDHNSDDEDDDDKRKKKKKKQSGFSWWASKPAKP